MLTLQRLRKIVDTPRQGVRVPTARQLRRSAPAIAEKRLDTDTTIAVYKNGYVLYQVRKRSTVFALHACRGYIYPSIKGPVAIEGRSFEETEWYLRPMLEGEDRLSRNLAETERHISYSDIPEGWGLLQDPEASPLDRLVVQEAVSEMLQALTEKQKVVVSRYLLQSETLRQISEDLGISCAAVSGILSRAIDRLRRSCTPEVLEQTGKEVG